MQASIPRFREWLAAEKEASEAERKLHREMLKSARSGILPDPEIAQTAHAKRAKAYCLFHEAMHEMRTLAESLQPRRIETRGASDLPAGIHLRASEPREHQ